jgi:signal transduction histidine kinase
MNALTHSALSLQRNLSLQKTLRYAEWALLLMLTLLYGIDYYFYEAQLSPTVFPAAVIFVLIFGILSLSFPIQRPRWQRRLYVATEILLFLIAQLFWIDFDVLLYFFLIKSCFLLSRREVIFTVFATGIGYLSTMIWTLPHIEQQFTEMMRSNTWEDLYKPQVILFSTLIEYIGISLFVVLLGFVILAERRSRQKAEALSQEIEVMAATLERSRIARDIHDSLGHSLTTLNIQLELAQAMRQRDPDQSSQALNNAQQLSNDCLEAVRHAVQTVRQEEFSLTAALHRLIAQIRQSQTFSIQADINLPHLSVQTSHQLYCVVQEGFTNIQKHAQASHVCCRAQRVEESIILELKDDGQGFDLTLPHEGCGLKGMYERVNLLGGKLQILSTPGSGTYIRVVIRMAVPQ